jgi:iron complex transport system ATP-binding protein
LTQQPHIILLDEPTSHLDLANKSRLVKILRELHETGSTIILTTHEPEAAAAVATEIVLLRNGQILTQGLSKDVFTAENLSEAYGVPVRIIDVDGQRIALWT